MKSGIEYFSLDCQLDDKFELIEAEFGLTGFSVVVKLFQKIYGGQGYYCEWNDEVALLFAKKIGLGGSVVSEIIKSSIKRGIFNQGMFDNYKILTSYGIQVRYLEAVSRRKIVKIEKAYLLVSCAQIPANVDISSKNVNINSKNEYISKQSKVKESKVKESKGDTTDKQSSPSFSTNLFEKISSLYNQTCKSYPKLTVFSGKRKKAISARLKTGYTLEDFERLFEKAEASHFLKGKNQRNWSATFDWLISGGNMAKVLDGNYDSRDLGTNCKASDFDNEHSYDLNDYKGLVNNFDKLDKEFK